MRYKFYIVSGGTFTPTGNGYATISGGTTYDIEKDFDGLLVSKIKGLDDKGEIKNRYTETYADSEKLRVYHPTTPLYKETTIKLDILFSKALRGFELDAFTNLIKSGTLIMYETSRGRCFEFVYMKDTVVSDEKMYGGQPYKEVEFELQNIRGYCDRFVMDVYNFNDTLTTRNVSTFVGATDDFVNNRQYRAGERFRLKKGNTYLAWEVVQDGWYYDRTSLTDDQFTAVLMDMQAQLANPPVKQVFVGANQVVKSGGHYYINTTVTQYAQIASYIADSHTSDITSTIYADNTTTVKTINMTTSRIYYTGSGFVKALSATKSEVYPICDGGIVKWMSANNSTYGVTQNALYVMDGTLFVAKPSINPA